MGSLTKEDWPKFTPYRSTPKESKFKIGSNYLPVDVPILPVENAIKKIYFLEELEETPQETYKIVKERLEKINKDLRNEIKSISGKKCNWIRIFIKKHPFAKKPYIIQFNIKWEDLLDFLKEIATDDKILIHNKYGYIFESRNFRKTPKTDIIANKNYWISDKNKEKVKSFVQKDVNLVFKKIEKLC